MSEGIPEAMKWQFKRLKIITKETVNMIPNKIDDVKPGQKIIVDLPYNSKVDLSTFTWFYDGETNHLGSGGASKTTGYVRTRFFPRNSASVIQNFQLKVNGGVKIDISDYNFLYNMLHDYTQGADALKRRQTGGENSDPSNKLYITSNDIIERRGYSIAPLENETLARDKGTYCVRSWLSLLGGNASTQIIDTALLGLVTLEITLAPASMLMNGVAVGGAVTAAENKPSKLEVGRGDDGTAKDATSNLAEETADYKLSNIKFYMARYHMDPEFDLAEANVLRNGGNYKLWFPNYLVYSGKPVSARNKTTTERMTISTNSLDFVLGTFRLPNFDTPGLPLNTIFSSPKALEEGESRATAESQINSGLRRVYNQSRYFAHNGDGVKTTTWRIGNNQAYNPKTIEEDYNTLLQHFNIHQDTISGMHPCINSIGAFREHSYASIYSLNVAEKSNIFTVSGMDTNQTPASIEWTVVGEPYAPAGGLSGSYEITPAANCLPYIICGYSSYLEISAGRIVNLVV